ncbi:peptide ABC transporter substrate-binding protein [Streptomyces spectabilis]|uniref:Peptide ABC transporter substrate-binding protein n=1 Tax=Streptomyces spectabilis TaxID=68270 RepID=A0A5P2XFN8_STRST|nr:peptide ABC transporter substrate-binding protein [Streptomyces spectabilis]MBB5101873.1 peptide/nickel transport system substrate-binding protein [Streptomyces spectabilis]MCI3906925.1 peptide ABC transporter substrate-binding protein [Streptomyces spectabilis]QEV63713.1 peptide ABC transporter substrate-binding protein [Streptomyces spectabilis]GGV34765.1 peptide ABC transporter substrate-binding protein [Streptomyces spectabilis]
MRALKAAAAAGLALAALTGCTREGGRVDMGPTGGTPVEGGTATMALPPAATPNWIFPIGAPGYGASYNYGIQSLLFMPVYDAVQDRRKGELTTHGPSTLGLEPTYSEGNRTVTVPLRKGVKWSDGTPVTARDLEFWFNLVKANKASWGNYSVGTMPDNVKRFETLDDHTVRLRLSRAYNPDWFTANQLTLMRALPQHAWSATSDGGEVGDFDRTKKGAKAVFARLTRHAKSLGSYGGDPLWKTVNGPWKLAGWRDNGQVTIVPNEKFTGPRSQRPHLDKVVFKPFTTADSEYNVLRSGGVDYGYIPPSVMAQKEKFEDKGYRVDPWEGWAATYIVYNFNSTHAGPLLRRLYIRQAMQHLVDQKAMSEVIWQGSATPTLGPVPVTPKSQYLSPAMERNQYPFSVARAKALLEAHGWRTGDGTARCERPGTGPDECGAGIAKDTPLKLTLLSQSGSTETTNMMQELKSSLSKAGIELTVRQQPLNSVLGNSVPCTAKDPGCDWDMSFFGTAGSWYYPLNPSGEQLFSTGASANFGNYSDKRADRIIRAVQYAPDMKAVHAYGEYLAEQLPVMWMPNPAYQVSVIRNDLRGVGQNPTVTFAPQDWYYVKKAPRGEKGGAK